MTKSEIIEKTLNDMKPLEPDYKEVVVAELERRLPDGEIKTCSDFMRLNAACCEVCHTFYAHYEMRLIDLPDATKAWVCDTVEWAIYPERREELRRWMRDSAEGKLLSQIFGDEEPDDSSSEPR
jgi:hypothetical protein